MRDHASPYSSMAAPGTAAGAATAALVQYVVLRGDLARSWSLGAVVAQGCHAALAAAHAHWQHPDTRAYLSEGGAMRTVVLEVRGAWRELCAEGSGWRPFWGGVFSRLWVPPGPLSAWLCSVILLTCVGNIAFLCTWHW